MKAYNYFLNLTTKADAVANSKEYEKDVKAMQKLLRNYFDSSKDMDKHNINYVHILIKEYMVVNKSEAEKYLSVLSHALDYDKDYRKNIKQQLLQRAKNGEKLSKTDALFMTNNLIIVDDAYEKKINTDPANPTQYITVIHPKKVMLLNINEDASKLTQTDYNELPNYTQKFLDKLIAEFASVQTIAFKDDFVK